MAFLCILELDLHLPENSDLKGKRKQVTSLKAALQRRFGVAVAETECHDKWQRARLSIALVGRDRRGVAESADGLQRFTESRFGDWVRWERKIFSLADLWES